MSYLKKNDRNWGVLIATLLAVPLGFAWAAVSLIGGTLVCSDEAAHCSGGAVPLMCGIAIIAAVATVVGWLINLAIRAISRDR